MGWICLLLLGQRLWTVEQNPFLLRERVRFFKRASGIDGDSLVSGMGTGKANWTHAMNLNNGIESKDI